MIVYIKNFRFTKVLGKPKINFEYFTGYEWKKLSVKNSFEKENVAVYTRYVMDCVIKDICKNEMDVVKRNVILKKFESDIMCMTQLNPKVFTDATKIFS